MIEVLDLGVIVGCGWKKVGEKEWWLKDGVIRYGLVELVCICFE